MDSVVSLSYKGEKVQDDQPYQVEGGYQEITGQDREYR